MSDLGYASPGDAPSEREGEAGVLNSPVPPVTAEEAAEVARRHFGIVAGATNLASERDANFHLVAEDGRGYVLKFANPAEPPENTNLQTEALLAIERRDPALPVPKVARALNGECELSLPLSDGRRSVVRLLSWVDGVQVARVGVSAALRRDIGAVLARLGAALQGFEHPASSHDILWDIKNAARLRPMTAAIPDESMRDRVVAALDRFEAKVAPRLAGLRQQVIHNDLNHHNVVVAPGDPDRVSGVLDFGDIVKTPLVIDVAVAASYLTALPEEALGCVCDMVGAYHRVVPLTRDEIALLPDLIVTRLITSISITSWRARRYPQNAAYILRNNGPAREGMARFAVLPRDRVRAALLNACEMGET